MCSGSKSKVLTAKEVMESEDYKKDSIEDEQKSVLLLELSATNDLTSFKDAVEKEGYDVDEAGLWYGRRVGSKKMGFEERTPLMVAAMFGSKDILNYILQTGGVDVNRASGSDGATALHCAAAGGSLYSHEVIKLLVESCADVDRADINGNRPCDVIAPCFSFSSKLKRRTLDILLNKGDQGEDACGDQIEEGQQQLQLEDLSPKSSSDGSGSERKEYPIDPSLPDIKNGIYGTDEFRMYTFKVKPCSRAYSHDWTECPFVHPGENARRRDPRKYHYSCVPCPEFRKGSCPKGDACEYAHGIFECWLHPAQYRTRLCKDETNCARRVCFFAHKPEELRPLYASTGSAVPSPRSYSSSGPSFDMGSLSPLALGSPPVMMPSTSTPPMTPTGASSPIGGAGAWQNHLNITPPPALQLPGSRLKAALSARDMDMESGLRRQQLLDELSGLSLSSPTSWNGKMGRLGGFSLSSPTGVQMRQNMNQQLLSSYSSGMPSSPVRGSSFGIEPSGSPVSNPRLAAFAKRSQSFVERNAVNRLSSPASNASVMPSHLSDWGSPDGKVDWGVQGDELSKLRKSASFAYRSNGSNTAGNPNPMRAAGDEPDVSWVHSLVKDAPPGSSNQLGFEEQLRDQYHLNSGMSERFPPWVEQLYMEQEPMAA
ncbi:zinc finger CCCH domain-containing protein 66-like [Chenopodium quinoa]|uniref:C3H1-type domain-containing protein n=1 Tax=Chenopodium quinoa TaxID=63459 RepID=A0A803LXE5_CHEQI|nr:zinc finger CCCH domain-containing protein 66-like [Chenopodium quinoa]